MSLLQALRMPSEHVHEYGSGPLKSYVIVRYFEKIGLAFQNRHFQSIPIFSILSHPRSFLF